MTHYAMHLKYEGWRIVMSDKQTNATDERISRVCEFIQQQVDGKRLLNFSHFV
jgi:hypothetical protein